ncbi:F-box/FBD/LRR-repeat protein [Raphanus sativus]|nr:F-box/FBD/LRR-repeat protein [Raphanus sativus]
MLWPQVFDGVFFGLWFQDLHTTREITMVTTRASRSIGLWINLALSRHLRELHIHIVIPYSKKGSVTLPSSLYTSETLQGLTLTKFVFLDVPVHVRLPSLKILSLESVTYANKTSLQRFLSGCPNLEVLSVERRFQDPPMDVNVVVPSLQRLYVVRTCGTYVLNVPFFEVP